MKKICRFAARLLAGFIILAAASLPASAATNCSSTSVTPEACQYKFPQNNWQAPWPKTVVGDPAAPTDPQISLGIRFNHGVTGALFNNYYVHPDNGYSAITPLFIDNNSASTDLFIPQKTQAEFSAFLTAAHSNSVKNVGLSYAVPPLTYSPTPTCSGLLGNATQTINAAQVPQTQTSGSNPVIVNYYTRVSGTLDAPVATLITVGSTARGSPYSVSYKECVTDAENNTVCNKFEEDQVVKFNATASNGTLFAKIYGWQPATPAVQGVGFWVSTDNGVTWSSVADCTKLPVINGVCGTANNVNFGATQPPGATGKTLCAQGNLHAVPAMSGGNWAWKCDGLDGGTQASCTAIALTYHWGGFGGCSNGCGNGTQTRTCYDQNNNPYPAANCTAAIGGSDSQGCSSYSYHYGSWDTSACSSGCSAPMTMGMTPPNSWSCTGCHRESRNCLRCDNAPVGCGSCGGMCQGYCGDCSCMGPNCGH